MLLLVVVVVVNHFRMLLMFALSDRMNRATDSFHKRASERRGKASLVWTYSSLAQLISSQKRRYGITSQNMDSR